MSGGQIRDMAASVRQRLANEASAMGRPFDEVLQCYAIERLLCRLSQSSHRERFVLKGAAMLVVWDPPRSRPTRDIDLLGHLRSGVSSVVQTMREVCGCEVEPDGLSLDAESVAGEAIREETEYGGVRVRLWGKAWHGEGPLAGGRRLR